MCLEELVDVDTKGLEACRFDEA